MLTKKIKCGNFKINKYFWIKHNKPWKTYQEPDTVLNYFCRTSKLPMFLQSCLSTSVIPSKFLASKYRWLVP